MGKPAGPKTITLPKQNYCSVVCEESEEDGTCFSVDHYDLYVVLERKYHKVKGKRVPVVPDSDKEHSMPDIAKGWITHVMCWNHILFKFDRYPNQLMPGADIAHMKSGANGPKAWNNGDLVAIKIPITGRWFIDAAEILYPEPRQDLL